MSASSRASVTDLPPLHRPKNRASINQASDDDLMLFDLTPDVVPPCPKPLERSTQYDQTRLMENIRFANAVLATRKLTPLGQKAFANYKEACKSAWKHLTEKTPDPTDPEAEEAYEDVRDGYIYIVRQFERSEQWMECLQLTKSKDVDELQQNLIKLHRIGIFARYGDALAIACNTLQEVAQKDKLLGGFLTGYWTDISKKLDSEEAAWERLINGGGGDLIDCPTWGAVKNSSKAAGYNFQDMIAIIKFYGERNELLHSDYVRYIKKGDYDTVKKQLANDLMDIALIFTVSEAYEAELLKRLLDGIIKEWFVWDDDCQHDVNNWGPSPKLRQYRQELVKSKKSDAQLHKEMTINIMKEVSKNSGARDRTIDLLERIDKVEIITRAGVRKKRVASAELAPEKDRVAKMQKKMGRIFGLGKELRNNIDNYIDEFGEFEAPPEIEEDKALNPPEDPPGR
jgi:hypothetical protein